MCVQIYRISENRNSTSFIHEEVCRDCALELQKKGLHIEIYGHLQKYVYEKDGITFYDEDTEIECSLCGEYLISEEDFLNE